jgi:hypothetical protein
MALFDWTPAMQFERATGMDGLTSAFANIMAGPLGGEASKLLTGSGKQGTGTADIFNALGSIFGGSGMASSSGGGSSGGGFDFTKLLSGGGGFSGGDLGSGIDSILNLFGGGKEVKPVTWNNWDPELLKLLQGSAKTLTPDLAGTTKEYNKETAMADAQGVVDGIFKQFQQQMPQIFNQQTARGAFNSTATQGLADQAMGEAVTKSAQAVLDNIKSYSAIRQGDVSVLAQMLGQGKGSISGSVPNPQSGGSSTGGDIANLVKIGASLFGF